MRQIRILLAVAIFGLTNAASADPILITDAAGNLTRMNDIDVNGTLYDVVFAKGSCVDIFDGCDDLSDFLFNTTGDADAASRALNGQVFTDPILDSTPWLVAGCEDTRSLPTSRADCNILTPWGFNGSSVQTETLVNSTNEFVDNPAATYNWNRESDFSDSNVVWAVWIPSSVPEPGTLSLLGMGLAAIGLSRRKRKS